MKKVLAGFLGIALFAGPAVMAANHVYQVRKHNGVPQIHCDGKPISSRIFHGQYIEGMWNNRGCKPVPQEVMFAKQGGVNTVMMSLNTSWSDEDDKILEAKLHKINLGIVTVNPDVRFIIRFSTAAPEWWKKKHQSEMSRFETGVVPNWLPNKRPNLQKEDWSYGAIESPSSKLYREGACQALERSIRLCEKILGKHMMGYLVLSQVCGECMYLSSYMENLDGYDHSAIEGFREYLKKKYGTVEALRKAWHNDKVTFETAELPSVERRKGDQLHMLREPLRDQDVIDLERYFSEAMSDMVLDFARAVKKTAPNRICLFFYGYLKSATHSFYAGGGQIGHYGLAKVLASPDVDGLCAPYDYNSRSISGYSGMQSVVESVHLAGKLWLNEDDTNTYLAVRMNVSDPGLRSAEKTREGSIKLLRRGLVAAAMRNTGIWWMDLHGIGWFLDPDLWDEMKARQDVETPLLQNPSVFEPQMAIVYDVQGLGHYIGQHPRRFTMAQTSSRVEHTMANTGAPFGSYMVEDIVAGKAPKVRLAVFGSSYALNGAQRKAMRAYAKDHAAVWMWGQGWIDLDTGKASVKAVEELTGFKVKELDAAKVDWKLTVTPEGKKYGLNPKVAYQAFPWEFNKATGAKLSSLVYPVLAVVPQKGDVVAATFSTGDPAIVVRPNGKNPNVFCGLGAVPMALLRKVAEQAGVYFAGGIGTVVFQNGPLTAMYASSNYKKNLTMPQEGTYVDLISGKEYTGKTFLFDMKKGDIVVFKKK